jgi:hypothetical protein
LNRISKLGALVISCVLNLRGIRIGGDERAQTELLHFE